MPYQTPRLCIDARSASELGSLDLVSGELIDQLVSGMGEAPASNTWISKHRTVLLAHDHQIFSGQLKRYNTSTRIGASPLRWAWEKNFVEASGISAFHRFRPLDTLVPLSQVRALTTLFSPRRSSPVFSGSDDEHFAVPSSADSAYLTETFQTPRTRIRVIRPGIRRFFQKQPPRLRPQVKPKVVILSGRPNTPADLPFEQSFQDLDLSTIQLSRSAPLTASTWYSLLRDTRLCIYTGVGPMDWAIPALEAFYCGVPVLFPSENATLAEMVANPAFHLETFFKEPPDWAALHAATRVEWINLNALGVFRPFSLAEQYRQIYEELSANGGENPPTLNPSGMA